MYVFSLLFACHKNTSSPFVMTDSIIQGMNAQDDTRILNFFPASTVIESLLDCGDDTEVFAKMEQAKDRIQIKQQQYLDKLDSVTLISVAITKMQNVQKGDKSNECTAQTNFQILQIQSKVQSVRDPAITEEIGFDFLYVKEKYYLFDM